MSTATMPMPTAASEPLLEEMFPTAIVNFLGYEGQHTKFSLTYCLDAPALQCRLYPNGVVAIALKKKDCANGFLWSIDALELENAWPEIYAFAETWPIAKANEGLVIRFNGKRSWALDLQQ